MENQHLAPDARASHLSESSCGGVGPQGVWTPGEGGNPGTLEPQGPLGRLQGLSARDRPKKQK